MVKLGDICSLITGAAFKSSEFQDEGVPVLKIANVKANRILFDGLQCVSEEIALKRAKSRIKYGDILLTMTGNRKEGGPDSWVGKAALFRNNGYYMLNQRLCILRANEEIVDNIFLAYYLSSWESQVYFINHATSSGGQANISPDTIDDYEIKLPDIGIQRKISAVLDVLDKKIQFNEKINRNFFPMAA
jgi:type I restriction enzyme S subunit